MAEKKKSKATKKTEPQETKDTPMLDKAPEGKPLSAYKKFEMKKHEVVHPLDEEHDEKIKEAEEKLRGMDLRHPVYLKDEHPIDPSWHVFFPSNQTGEQLSIIIQQRAGGTMPLLEAPSFLKRGAVRLLGALLEYAPVAQEEAEAALKAERAENEDE